MGSMVRRKGGGRASRHARHRARGRYRKGQMLGNEARVTFPWRQRRNRCNNR